MSNISDLKCVSCGEQLECVRYFPPVADRDDMRLEQEYFGKRRAHNRYLHGWASCRLRRRTRADAKT